MTENATIALPPRVIAQYKAFFTRKLEVADLSECPECFDEGSYEVMYLGPDGEVGYYNQVCAHEFRGEAVSIRINK